MTTITIQTDDLSVAARLLAVLSGETTAVIETPKPKRGKKTETTIEDAPATAAEINPLAPVAQIAGASAIGAVAPTAPAATQQDLIKAFVTLGQAKGGAAMSTVLQTLGAATVAAIPQAKWVEAIELANKARA